MNTAASRMVGLGGESKFMKISIAVSIALLAVVYVLVAKLGLSFATVHGNVTAIWPPSGIALAALLIYGGRLWPGVFVGAFLANMLTAVNVPVALGIACGNTLEALLGLWLIHRMLGQDNPLTGIVKLFIFFAIALFSPIVAAIVGPLSLVIGGFAGWSEFSVIAGTWWLGDAAGIFIIGPVFLAWQKKERLQPLVALGRLEIVLFTVLLTLTSGMVFVSWIPSTITDYPLAFVMYPFCMWAAYRYGLRGATLTILVIMVFATVGTSLGHGPFARETLNGSLFLLQSFMAITVVTTLTLAIAVLERRQIESQLILEKERAEKLVHAKAQFMSQMSHELRTPLNAVIGFSEILQNDENELIDDHRKFVGYIAESGKHLLYLVNDVLDIAQTDSNKLGINITRIQLEEFLSASIRFIEPAATKHDINIVYDEKRCTGIHVMADSLRLRQVLINLLSNAAKYNHEGGSITVTCHQTESEKIRIAITDTGEGIAEEDIPGVFEPFGRLGAEDTGVEGTGIGLTITRRLVELMHGSIGVESCPGKGSTFWIELPC